MPAQGIQELLDWQAKEEAEDPDEKRKEFYGNAGGEIFGIVSGLLFVRVCVCAWLRGVGVAGGVGTPMRSARGGMETRAAKSRYYEF